MDRHLHTPRKQTFSQRVGAAVRKHEAETSPDVHQRPFESPEGRHRVGVCLFEQLQAGGATMVDPSSLPPDLVAQIPSLLQDFDRLRFLTESDSQPSDDAHLSPDTTPPLA